MSRNDPAARWEGDDAPPTGWSHVPELLWNVGRLVGTFRKRGPRGPEGGQPVLVIPGFLCGDQTTFVLRRELARAGFRVHGWKQGWNLGAREDTLERLRKRVDNLGHKQPLVIVGWSLGGLFAREFARYFPEHVKAVITLGSPFSGDPRQNNVWKLYERVAGHSVDNPPIPRITDKPSAPHLALWSGRDGLIAPRAARGLDYERDKAVELQCHHMAFGVSSKAARATVREIVCFLDEIGGRESRH